VGYFSFLQDLDEDLMVGFFFCQHQQIWIFLSFSGVVCLGNGKISTILFDLDLFEDDFT
jgi:hypothetical protein